MWSIEWGDDGRRPGRSPFPTEQLASAAAVVDRTGLDRFVHDPADGAGAAAAFGTAAQAPVDFAGAARRAFGRDRPDLMVGNHVARTHDHGGTPCSDRPLRTIDLCRRTRQPRYKYVLATPENSCASAMM